jgi:2,4-dienoyl-CoA reductase (NADPH2)
VLLSAGRCTPPRGRFPAAYRQSFRLLILDVAHTRQLLGTRDLEDPLRRDGIAPFIIGGPAFAAEFDAKRAINQATELGARL